MENDRSQIEEIKSRLDITTIVERHVKLRKAGKNYSGLCPFHTEKTPSFIVSPSIQRYKCFGCGESGDIFNFVEKVEHLDFTETLEKLAKEAGVVLKKSGSPTQTIYSKIVEINTHAAQLYYDDLVSGKNQEAYEYVTVKRAFTKETMKLFSLGYAIGGTRLLQYIRSKGQYRKEDLLQTGLFTEKNGEIKDRFFKRVIFPIKDQQGKIVGFTGRNLPSSDYGPKYLHTPETPLFQKGHLLYGLYEAKPYIRENDMCIICEGTTDAISAYQRGYKNIVAPLGTAITQDQLALAKRFTGNLLCLLDSDEAGQKALERAFILGIEIDLNLYTGNPSPYKDVDELMKSEPEKLQKIIFKRQDLFEQLVVNKLEKEDLTSYRDYKEIISYVHMLLSHVKNEQTYQFYMEKAAQITTIDKNYFFSKPETRTTTEYNPTEHKKVGKADKEAFLLASIIYFGDVGILEKIDTKFILRKDIKSIVNYIKEIKEIEENSLLSAFPEYKETITEAIFESSRLDFEPSKRDKYLLDTYKNIKRESIETVINRLKVKQRIASVNRDSKEEQNIFQEIIRLKKLQTD